MYSKDEIEDLFSRLKDYITSSAQTEINYYLNMNAVFVEMLLHDAENQTVTLQAEPSHIENMNNIKEMNDFINSLTGINPSIKGQNIKARLQSISNTENLIENYETLKHDYDILMQQVESLKSKNEMLMNENQNLQTNLKDNNDMIAKLRNEIKIISSPSPNKKIDKSQILNNLEIELANAKKNLDEQIAKYQLLLKDFDKRVSESTQFKQLKKILMDKNKLIVELKTKVASYEENK